MWSCDARQRLIDVDATLRRCIDVGAALVRRGVATTHVGYYAALVKRLKHSQSSSSCHDCVFMTIVSLLDPFHKHLRLNYII